MGRDRSLDWPEGWPRTPATDREKGTRFRKADGRMPTVADGIRDLLQELERMGATEPIVETARPTKKDGMPYSQSAEPDDPGVIVRWTLHGTPYVMACDTYQTNAANLRAVALTLEAMRAIDRHGAVNQERAYKGLERLPPRAGGQVDPNLWYDNPPNTQRPAHKILGVDRDAPASVVKAAFKARARDLHPDKGGSATAFNELMRAKEAMLDA